MEHVKIYQGNQIGGCVTVISSMINGEIHRIMVDYGSSLPGSDNEKDFDYPWDDEPVDAVFFTHYHGAGVSFLCPSLWYNEHGGLYQRLKKTRKLRCLPDISGLYNMRTRPRSLYVSGSF